MDNIVLSLSGEITAVNKEKLLKLGVTEGALKEAKANSLVPKDFDAERNFDVLPVVFSLAVVNQFNLNGDGMDAETAADAIKHFKNKPINIEHKKDQIVGHIINASFSDKEPDFNERDTSKFTNKKTPFFITAAGLIYSHIYPDLAAALVEASDPSNETYKSISASWEIAFGSFDIVVGTEKDLVKGYILPEEEKEGQIKNLMSFGGSGRNEFGQPVRTLIKKPAYPLGAALTLSPAARVKGIFIGESLFSELENKKEHNKSSHLNKKHVRKEKSHIMDEKQFNTFLDTVVATLQEKNVSEANQKSILGEIKEALDKRSKEWEQEKTVEKEALASKEQELKDAQARLEELENENVQVKDELSKIKSQVEAQEKSNRLQRRMKLVEDKFDLSDAESEIIASELAKLGEEDSEFENYNKKLDILFAHKNKEVVAKQKEQEKVSEVKESKASETEKEDEVEDELETTEAKTQKVPNSNSNQTETSLLERVRKTLDISYSGQK